VPDFRLEAFIKNVSESDMEYIIYQIEEAIKICNGKFTLLSKEELDDE
jgi:hypothetical protein